MILEKDFMVDFIEKPEHPKDFMYQSELTQLVMEMLGTLKESENAMIRLRYGLDGMQMHSLEEIAIKFHISRERVRQVLLKAIRKLRVPRRSKKVKNAFLYHQ